MVGEIDEASRLKPMENGPGSVESLLGRAVEETGEVDQLMGRECQCEVLARGVPVAAAARTGMTRPSLLTAASEAMAGQIDVSLDAQ